MSKKNISFTIKERKIEAIRWGEGVGHPVIALHGWLDNAASFDVLGPKLQGFDIVALDLAGQGHSDWRGQLGGYPIWSDIAEILDIADQLGWSSFSLLGHSRGAMVSAILAGAFPERVRSLVLLDGLMTHTELEDRAPQQLANSISHVLKLQKRQRNYYDSFQDAVAARANGFVGVAEDDAAILASRGVLNDGVSWYWGSDPLVAAPSEFKLTPNQARAFLDAITCSNFVAIAKNGLLRDHDLSLEWLDNNPHVNRHYFEGGHHFHMTELSPSLLEFIQTGLNKG